MQSSDRDAIRSDINVTPLVDVCLVLLIIFMVVTPLINDRPPLRLPKGSNPGKKPQTAAQVPISLLFDRPPQILFGKSLRHVSPEELQAAAEELHQNSPNSELVLRADRRLLYRDIRAALLVLRKAGFHNVGLIAEQEAKR
jgi:biopolymer transport protein ExbD